MVLAGVVLLAGQGVAEQKNLLVFGNSYSHGVMNMTDIAAGLGNEVHAVVLRGSSSGYATAIDARVVGTNLWTDGTAKVWILP